MHETIGTRLLHLRGQDLSQEKLADEIGVSRSLVKAWENNERPVRSDHLVKLIEYFHVSADYLLGIVDEDNSTSDEKLRMVSEYTGLSNGAITSIQQLQKSAAHDLSEMLCNKSFLAMITCLDDYRMAYNKCCDYTNLVSLLWNGANLDDDAVVSALNDAFGRNVPDEECITDEALGEFASWYGQLRLQLFELSEMWTECLNAFMPAKYILAGGKEIYRKYTHDINEFM